MRLAEIRHILLSEHDCFKVTAQGIPNSPNGNLSNHQKAVKAARLIQKTGILQDETAKVLEHDEIVNSVSDKIVVHVNTLNSFQSALTDLHLKTLIIIKFLNEYVGEQPVDTVSVKLPSHKDIDSVARNMTTLKLALDQALLHEPINGHVELISFERGSNWIELSVGGMVAYSFIGGMLKLIYASKEKEIDLDLKREMVRSVRIQNDSKESLLMAQETILNALDRELEEHYANSVGALLSEHNISDDDKEYPARLGHSLRLLSELISEGVEVHPTLISQESTMNAFPDPQKLVHTLGSLPDKLIEFMTKSGGDTEAPHARGNAE